MAMKKEPDWARWRTWLIAASATAIPSGVTAGCGQSIDGSCGGIGGDYSGDDASMDPRFSDAAVPVSDCAPGNVSSFVPVWKPPTGFNQGKCTDAQTAAYVDCLRAVPVPNLGTCQAFASDPTNKACLACALTLPTAAKYGPLLNGAVTVEVNTAGCIAEVTGDLSDAGCAASVLAAVQCEQLACETNCPVSSRNDSIPLAALLACEGASGGSVCKAFTVAARCADALTADGGVAAACAQGASFTENAKAMVKLFCGGAGDGGTTDSGSDG